MKKDSPISKTHSFRLKRSRTGLGLFADSAFKKGDLVVLYTGERITSDEADRRGGKYLFDVNSKWTIDGKGRENIARYINHSCRPNCEPEVNERNMKISIHAKRNIKPGEELTYDYGKEYWNEYIKPHGCKCAKCTTA